MLRTLGDTPAAVDTLSTSERGVPKASLSLPGPEPWLAERPAGSGGPISRSSTSSASSWVAARRPGACSLRAVVSARLHAARFTQGALERAGACSLRVLISTLLLRSSRASAGFGRLQLVRALSAPACTPHGPFSSTWTMRTQLPLDRHTHRPMRMDLGARLRAPAGLGARGRSAASGPVLWWLVRPRQPLYEPAGLALQPPALLSLLVRVHGKGAVGIVRAVLPPGQPAQGGAHLKRGSGPRAALLLQSSPSLGWGTPLLRPGRLVTVHTQGVLRDIATWHGRRGWGAPGCPHACQASAVLAPASQRQCTPP